MTVLRRLARPMLASVFVVDGLDAVRNPDAHTAELERVRPQLRKVTEAVGLPDDPRLLIRVGGAIKLVAGFSLATSRMPRVAAFVLAVLTVKDTLLRYPVWEAQGPVERHQLLEGALQSVSRLGGLLIAGADTAGKPSLAWRARAAKDRAAAKLDG